MKKSIFGFVATVMFSVVSFANTPTMDNEIDVKNENNIEKKSQTVKEETVVTVTCTAIMADGTVYTATAGNWFSTTEGATARCKAKLFDQIMGIQ